MKEHTEGGERSREPCEQDHDRGHEPHVVRLPYRPNGVSDGRSLTVGGGTARQQVPQPASIVGATKQGVQPQRDE